LKGVKLETLLNVPMEKACKQFCKLFRKEHYVNWDHCRFI